MNPQPTICILQRLGGQARQVLETLFFLMMAVASLSACDPEGRQKCDWVLEPDSAYIGKVDEGFIPVCARNRATMKQDCRLQTTLEFAKSAQGKRFRYDHLKVQRLGIPRTIKNIEYCE